MSESIPEGWKSRKLGDLAEMRRGITYSADALGGEDGGPYFINMKSFLKGGGYNRAGLKYFTGFFQDADVIEERDLLIANTDVTQEGDIIGAPALVPASLRKKTCLFSHHVTRLRLNHEIEPEYLSSLLCLPDNHSQMLRIARGTTVLMLDFEAVRKVAILLPPLPTQRRIAAVLRTVDEVIEATEARIEKQQAIKQGLLHDLFTRGVTPDGQLRPPPTERPDLYQESELGLIPKEWDWTPLRDALARAEYGISISLDDDRGVPVLRMNNLAGGRMSVSDIKFSNSPEANRLLLHDKDILFNRTNSLDHVGRTSIWRNELPFASFASYLVRLVPNLDKISPEYLNLWLNRPVVQIDIRRFATPGVHQVNINPTNLQRTFVALPQLTEQDGIVAISESAEGKIATVTQQLTKLRQLKSALMQDLLTGRVSADAIDLDDLLPE